MWSKPRGNNSLLTTRVQCTMSMNVTAKPRLRMLYVMWAFMECLFFGGLLYGWSSLVFILKDEGIYAHLCKSNSNMTSVNYTSVHSNMTTAGTSLMTSAPTTASHLAVAELNMTFFTDFARQGLGARKGCKEQDSMLTLVFTVGSSLFCAGCAVMGHINYKFGTRVTRICSMIVFVAGCLMIAFVSVDYPWLIFPGLSCIGIGGIPLLVTNTQISNLFTSGSSTVVGLMCGAFDGSAAIQLIVKLAYEKGFSRQYSYFVLIGMHSLVLVSTFFYLPKDFIHKLEPKSVTEVVFKVDEDEKDGKVELLASEKKNLTSGDGNGEVEYSVRKEKENSTEKEVKEPLTGNSPKKPTLKSCLLSPVFILHVFWLCVLQLRFYFYLGSLNPWLTMLLKGDRSQVSFFTNISLYLMLGGIVTSPLAGIVYDWQKRIFINKRSEKCRQLMPSVFPLSFTILMAIILSILVLIPMVQILYLAFIILTVFRSFLYAMAAAFISAMFPSEYFGLLYGVLIVSGGVFTFSQYALFYWAEVGSFQQVNIFLLILVCTSFIHPAYQWYSSHRVESFTLKQEAQRRSH